MPSVITYNGDTKIRTKYWFYLEEVLLDFDPSWRPGSEVGIHQNGGFGYRMQEHRIRNCPRCLIWAPPTPNFPLYYDVYVEYSTCDGGSPCIGMIGTLTEVKDLARKARYQGEIAHLELTREFGCGKSSVRLMVRKVHEYYALQHQFKLSIAVEFINRDDFNHLLQYERKIERDRENTLIADNLPVAWRGSEAVISDMRKSPYQKDRSDVLDNIKHVAYESIPSSIKRQQAESEAIERGLSLSDFLWESPDQYEGRVVCHQDSPSSHRDGCLRGLRLNIRILSDIFPDLDIVRSWIVGVELKITSIPTSPPSLPHAFSSLKSVHIDVADNAPVDSTVHNSSDHAQTLNIAMNAMAALGGTNSATAGTCITTNGFVVNINVNGPLQGPLQITGPITGDIFSGPISGGNIGGRGNINHSVAQSPALSSSSNDGVFRRFQFRAALRGLFQSTKSRREALPQVGGSRVP